MKQLNFGSFVGFAVLAAAAMSNVAFAAMGDLFVSNTPTVVKVTVTGTKSPFSSPLLSPSGIAFDHSGNLFAADATANLIIKVTSDGTQSTFLPAGLSSPRGLAFDAAGNLFVADSGTNSVLKVTPTGVTTTFALGLNGPRGLAFDLLGNLFVANSSNNSIVKITPTGNVSGFVSAGLNSPYGLAFDASGNLFVGDSGSNSILKITSGGTVSTFVSVGLNSPHGLTFDASGNLLVADSGGNAILKVAANGTVSPDVSGLVAPEFLALAPALHELYNISTRGFVQTGNHVLIGGFIIRGTPLGDLGNTTVVVRAIGPELSTYGISDFLMDPTLALYNSSGTMIASNNDWKSNQQTEIEASGLAPTDDRESALMVTLPDGDYTAIVRGVNGSVGTALVEVYKPQLP